MQKTNELWLIVRLLDDAGKELLREEKPSQSFVVNLVKLRYHWFSLLSLGSVVNTAGAGQTLSAGLGGRMLVNAAVNDGTFGIVVGTGTNAVALGDTALQTIIAHGSGSGQLSHQAVGFVGTVLDGQTAKFQITRNLVNNSGGQIVVREAGIYVNYNISGVTQHKFCIVRDLHQVTVNATQTLGVTYEERNTA